MNHVVHDLRAGDPSNPLYHLDPTRYVDKMRSIQAQLQSEQQETVG